MTPDLDITRDELRDEQWEREQRRHTPCSRCGGTDPNPGCWVCWQESPEENENFENADVVAPPPQSSESK